MAAVMTPLKDVASSTSRIAQREPARAARHAEWPLSSLQGQPSARGRDRRSRSLLRAATPASSISHLPMTPPLYAPVSLTLMELLRHFRDHGAIFALVVNEFGVTEGVVPSPTSSTMAAT